MRAPGRPDDGPVPRFLVPLKVAACFLLVGGAVAVIGGLFMQFHIEPTDAALYEGAVGADQVKLALVVVPLALVGIVAGHRAVALAAVVVAAVVLGGAVAWTQVRMHPEAGLRAAAADFVPPAGARPVESPFDGYDRPDLRRSWALEDADVEVAAACAQAAAALGAWAGGVDRVRPQPWDDDCAAEARRGKHDGLVIVRPSFAQGATGERELTLVVTRRP